MSVNLSDTHGSQASLGKNCEIEKYIVTLQAEKIEQLRALVAKGKHTAQKVINALILLNCDESQGRQSRRSNLRLLPMAWGPFFWASPCRPDAP